MDTDNRNWPAWRYGPNGAADIFHSDAEVPAGWKDHPSKVGDKPAKPATVPATTPGGQAEASNTEIDADGWPWDAAMHAPTKTKTKAGLWRMKVGANRPDPKPGFPKPVLDL